MAAICHFWLNFKPNQVPFQMIATDNGVKFIKPVDCELNEDRYTVNIYMGFKF